MNYTYYFNILLAISICFVSDCYSMSHDRTQNTYETGDQRLAPQKRQSTSNSNPTTAELDISGPTQKRNRVSTPLPSDSTDLCSQCKKPLGQYETTICNNCLFEAILLASGTVSTSDQQKIRLECSTSEHFRILNNLAIH